jgi:hypothetical protein
MDWFKKGKFIAYKEQLKKAFPAFLHHDLEHVLDILPLGVNKTKLNTGEVCTVDDLIHSSTLVVCHKQELLTIPYRIYFNEPVRGREAELSPTQKAILNCIYLRHHDGYVRQRRLEQLLDYTEDWIIPFTFQLLGDYVLEILQVLDHHMNSKNIPHYKNFILENEVNYQQTESRMISYWNEYYRRSRFTYLKNYPGRKIFDRLRE